MATSSYASISILLFAIACVIFTISALSIDVGGEVDTTTRADVEVEFDLDPESKMQFDQFTSSRSDRPVLGGRKLPDGEPMGINIRPVGSTKKLATFVSTVLEPSGFNFGRGVAYATTQDVSIGGELLSLPMDKVMSLKSAARGRVGLLLEVNPDLPPAIAMALHLLEERALGASSNYSEFISTLPLMEGLNSSMFYDKEETDELEGSQLLRYTVVRENAVEAFYDALLEPVTSAEAVDPPIFKKEAFTLENFRYAMGVVWASAFPFGNREEDVVLAPILSTIGLCTEDDGSNNVCPPSRVEFDQSNNRLVVYATSLYTTGQEVRLTMPGKPSVQLMLNNGFMRSHPSRQLDKVDITIALDPSDPLVDVKNFMVQSHLNESINGSYELFYDSDKIGEKISTSLKLKLLSGSEMPRFMDLLPPKEKRKIPRVSGAF